MNIYYASMTGNVKRFVSKLGTDAKDIKETPVADAPYVLVCYTIGFGEVPKEVSEWLKVNSANLRGVVVSGNRNWGESFGKAGDIISRKYGIPLIHKFELAGNVEDVQIVKERADRL